MLLPCPAYEVAGHSDMLKACMVHRRFLVLPVVSSRRQHSAREHRAGNSVADSQHRLPHLGRPNVAEDHTAALPVDQPDRQPDVNVTSVIQPLSQRDVTKVISYQSAYDSLNRNDEPSSAVSGGFTLGGVVANVELAVFGLFLADGYTVIVPDTHCQRADFAAGAAMGGVLVHPARNLLYVEGSYFWAGVMPMALIGIARAFEIDFTPYVSRYGAKVFQGHHNCSSATPILRGWW